jgi:phage shock protein A
MEEKIEQSERQLKASSEIDEEFSGDRLAHDFKRLEKSTSGASADMQLLALKQKMGMLPAPAPNANTQLGGGQQANNRQLGAGRPAAAGDADETAEVEALPEEKKAR